VFRAFAWTGDLRLLHAVLSQSPIHLFVILVGGTRSPLGFDRVTYFEEKIDAVENWAEYSIGTVANRERWRVRAAAGGEPVEAWLDIDDGPFRLRADTPILGPMALPTEEGSVAGAALQTLVAKALRCDLYITEAPDLIDFDGGTGYKMLQEALRKNW